MTNSKRLTVLCLASYEKGAEFLRECKRQNCRVVLLTSHSLSEVEWPREAIDEIFYMPDDNKRWNINDVINGVSYMARKEVIDRIVPLEEFDLETAATLREHLRIPGMGETTTRYFRDKLAMRIHAREEGIPVPDFTHVLNYDSLNDFMSRVSPPWVLKPRFEGAAAGIKKITSKEDFWYAINSLGDRQSFHVLERYVPGDIFHIDSIVCDGKIVFAAAHQYGRPPMDIAHQGGIFTTRTMEHGSEDEQSLLQLNQSVLRAMGLQRGVSHTEFIKGRDGRYYFLETSARVGGANIVELIEASTGMNLWAEWAKLEISDGRGEPYKLPEHRSDYGGLLVSLTRQEYPDTSAFNDPEIAWRMKKKHHLGLIVRSSDPIRVQQLLDDYINRVYHDFLATMPPQDRPTA